MSLISVKIYGHIHDRIRFSAGQDGTDTFFGLHRFEVLEKKNYARLQIGTIEGEKPVIRGRRDTSISKIPYGEPTWLSPGYYSPYYNEVCYSILPKYFVIYHIYRVTANSKKLCGNSLMMSSTRMHRRVVFFVSMVYLALRPNAQAREEDGKRPSQGVVEAMATINLHAMRLGPGKHLKGLTLFNGLVKPEEVYTRYSLWIFLINFGLV